MVDDPRRQDLDPEETREWVDALEAVLEHDGTERAQYLIERLSERFHRHSGQIPFRLTTEYINTIPPDQEARRPGDYDMERKLKSMMRWNAAAMVVRANRAFPGLGGHIASYQSVANLWEIGFNNFFRAPTEEKRGDLVFFQGHSSPGVYARSFLEHRLDEEHLDNFRREVETPGLSSYPHPWLMPDFWCVPTVSMGLGAMMAVYQARFMKYLHNRGILDTSGRKVWAYLGDGEMDEPESVGALSIAARENLDNLIFVVNCNLQRLDGPVRGNGKIIQELETTFRGAGWNVIKLIWGRNWDPLLARDDSGLLRKRMMEVVDGDYQTYAAKDGAYVRKHFFGADPELEDLVASMTDEEIWHLKRGGHDPFKVYAAYHAAANHEGQPTVILAKTVKGYGMGEAGEGQNITHQQKKMDVEQLKRFRDRFRVPVSDEEIEDQPPYYRPDKDSEEYRYLKSRRDALGGWFPRRVAEAEPLEIPDLEDFKLVLDGSKGREMSTTMAFVRILSTLLRDKAIQDRIVPIVADEARTFGMEGLFRQTGIYSPKGQVYEPVDADQLLYYRETKDGQMLQEGLTEAGAFSSWAAAGSAYANHGINMVPFFIFYSMFGFQRIGDLIWAAADMRARGFLIGGTSGRTTLNGEGLQHEDGQSHVQASVVPTCVAYDPTFGYEMAVIIHDGLRRMYVDEEPVFYYITANNQNYEHPPLPEGADGERVKEGILRGMYRLKKSGGRKKARVQLLGSGTILLEVLAAAELLESDHGVDADVWSVTGFNELRGDGLAVDRWNRLHPEEDPRRAWVTECLEGTRGPVVASTDFMRAFPDQIRPWVPRRYTVLGTDGFGRSDTREALRRFFEVDRHHVVVAALAALAEEGTVPTSKVTKAMEEYDIDPDRPAPWTV
ncbi:MAG: pyruvate dehydrogenase (acetyl-transferring), homodimeric type [Thermoanaerobaculia bacterium]